MPRYQKRWYQKGNFNNLNKAERRKEKGEMRRKKNIYWRLIATLATTFFLGGCGSNTNQVYKINRLNNNVDTKIKKSVKH